jgi:hypothetical protein
VLTGSVFARASASQAPAPAPAPAPAATPADDVESPEDRTARATFEAVCSACHEPAIATTTLRTRQEWAEVLDLMVSYGATASDAQFMDIQRYLGRRYGRVNVNRAPLEELQLVLNVSPEVAQAIVDYRMTMRITSADDLQSIPGLSAERLAQLRPHLQF